MTKDVLLDAIGSIDEQFIADAQQLREKDAQSHPRRRNRKTIFLIAAAVISILAFSVYAAGSERVCNWALDYLCGNTDVLEGTYLRTAEEIIQNVNQTVETNHCVITLQAAISDGIQSYLAFHVVLPEGMHSNSKHYSFESQPIESSYSGLNDEKPYATSYGWRTIPDDNPDDNEMDMILNIFTNGDSPIIPHTGYTWSIRLDRLYTYGDDPDNPLSHPTIAEGPWEFRFTYSAQYPQEPHELIEKPIPIWASKTIISQRFSITYPVRAVIESFQVWPMTATCSIRVPNLIPVGDFTMHSIYLVMKNGDIIEAHHKSCYNDSKILHYWFAFDIPIDEANIDYVLFPGNNRVYMNGE